MQKKLKIESAFSMNNGIGIDSVRHKGYAAIATIDENGCISTKWAAEKPYEEYDVAEAVKKLVKVIKVWAVFVIIAIIYSGVRSNPIYAVRTFIVGIGIVFISALLINILERVENTGKFHGAEHMVCNAFRKLERIPTLEEIVSYSRFSKNCGTNFHTAMLMWCVFALVATLIPNEIYMFIGMVLESAVILILLQSGHLNFMQRFTTEEPTERELIVAIEAMKVFIENENKEMEK